MFEGASEAPMIGRRGFGAVPCRATLGVPLARVLLVQVLLVQVLLALPAPASAQIAASARADDFPSRTITIVVPFTPGGSADVLMRMVGQKLGESVKQTVLIDNRPGGGGNVGALAVKLAAPDGYMLFMAHTGTHAVNVSLYADLKFDPVKDFQPITPLMSFPSILVVPATSPARTLAELVAFAKAKSGGLSYASQGVGAGGHLLGEMLARDLGVPMVHVPYRGVAPAITDLIAGRVDFLFSSPISALAHVEDGKLRILAITGDARSPILPQVATMTELGYPSVNLRQWFGIVAPRGTPAAVVRKLNDEFIKAVRSKEVSGMLVSQATEVFTMSPEEFLALIRSDIIRLGKVVRDSGARAD
jgi:tripartite-type tricarboxylate transporter receptor subunit TctC